MSMMLHRILQGDVLKGLAALPDRSVQAVVTSPPYLWVRDYEVDGQIGLEATLEEYVQKIVEVSREIWRVLREDGVYFLNLGDSYSGSGKGPSRSISRPCQDMSGTRASGIIPSGLKAKDMVGMPWRVALALQADGWWWRKWFPWIKANPLPESVDDRPGSSLEVIHMFTKSGDKLYWTHRDRDSGTRERPEPDYRWVDRLKGEELTEEPPRFNNKDKVDCPDCSGLGEVEDPWLGPVWCETCSGERKVKRWTRINLWRGHDYFWDGDAVRVAQTGRAHSRGNGLHPKSASDDSEIRAKDSFNLSTAGIVVSGGRNRRDGDWFFESWQGLMLDGAGLPQAMVVNPEPFPGSHFAVFPSRMVLPLIKAATSEKGCCPACGAPYERIVEKGAPDEKWKAACGADSAGEYSGQSKKVSKQDSLGKSTYTGLNKRWKAAHPPVPQNASDVKRRILEGMRERVSRWVPTCTCNAGAVPCTALDPFAGKGTVAEVARDLGRSSVSIELSPKFVQMIKENLRISEQLDTGVCRYEVVEL